MKYPIIRRDAWGYETTVSYEQTWTGALQVANQLNTLGDQWDTYFAGVMYEPKEAQ